LVSHRTPWGQEGGRCHLHTPPNFLFRVFSFILPPNPPQRPQQCSIAKALYSSPPNTPFFCRGDNSADILPFFKFLHPGLHLWVAPNFQNPRPPPFANSFSLSPEPFHSCTQTPLFNPFLQHFSLGPTPQVLFFFKFTGWENPTFYLTVEAPKGHPPPSQPLGLNPHCYNPNPTFFFWLRFCSGFFNFLTTPPFSEKWPSLWETKVPTLPLVQNLNSFFFLFVFSPPPSRGPGFFLRPPPPILHNPPPHFFFFPTEAPPPTPRFFSSLIYFLTTPPTKSGPPQNLLPTPR